MPSIAHRGRAGRRAMNEINMVPFIDVMLVLLIIFMVTAPLITPSVINLPSVGKASRLPDQVIQIVVGKDDSLVMKIKEVSSPVTLQDMVQQIKQAQATDPNASNISNAAGAQGATAPAPSTAVVISADKHVQYERVVSVMDTLQRAGIERVGLSVQLAQ